MAASNVQDYLLCVESDKAEAGRIAADTAEKLQSRQHSLLDVVQSLGEYINDEDSRIRGRAVSYLTAVLSALPPKYLSRQQIDVLCHFFSDRIEDGGAIEGLTKLQELDRFTDEMAQTVVRALFEHFPDFRIRPPSSRRQILQLLNTLMSRHRKALQMMGDESLVGIVELVNGEKDPRSLMLVFSMCRVLIVEWDISNHAEALFNTVYAYFPITFRPPPNDPYGITAQDLKDRLRDCISASKYLAPYAIPNLLDKLDSTYSIVKKDVLQALLACAGSYDASTMSLYSITLWDCLKFEVLSAQEPELAEQTLVVLRAIARCLSRSSQNSTTASPLAQYIRPITKECIEHLQEPLQRQAKASGDILKAVSSATPETFDLVAKAVMAPILTIYQSTFEIAKHRALLIVLNQLFDSAVVVFGHWTSTDPHPGIDNPLEAFSDKLLEILGQSLMSTVKEEVSFRVASAQGLQKLAVVRDLLQENEVRMIVHHFNEIVLHGESDGQDELKRTAMESLAEISKHKPRLIMDVTFPAFMAQLPDTDEEAEARGDYHTTLEGLAEISIQREVFDTLVRRLLSRLDVLLKTSVVESPRYTSALLSTILFVMNRKGLEHDVNTPVYFDRIVTALVSRATNAAAGESSPTALNTVEVLEVLGRLSNLIVRYSSGENKTIAADNIYDLFSMQSGLEKLAQAPKGSLLGRVWILSMWLLAALPRNLQDPLLQTARISELLPRLLELLKDDRGPISFVAISHQVALYINKHLPSSELGIASGPLKELYSDLSSLQGSDIAVNDQSQQSVSKTIRTIFVIAKALTLRLSPDTNAILTNLMSLLDASKYPPPVNKEAASSFSFLLAPDAVLSKENGAQIRLLAPQQVFQTLTPLISAGFRSSSSSHEGDSANQENYLTALSGIIATVPPDLVVPELPTLLPLLLQSLDLPTTQQKGGVKTATLETLAVVIARNPSILAESGHVPSLVKRLLKIATSASASASMPKRVSAGEARTKPAELDTAQARQLAARCLLLMPRQLTGSAGRSDPLLALKREVVAGLGKVLDDPKREVRKEAVDARGAWLRGVDDEVDEEEEDSELED